ncbi:MAG: ABC transporter ATP-binding protein [Clostridia bacterium]|nr:ABC transporter ATP-binding protein [Clostridia bacterium]
MEREVAVRIQGLKKEYRLGVISGGTLQRDVQSLWARIRKKEDPNTKVGSENYRKNEKFTALDDINLTVYKGERLGIIGKNGAGKSTLLKLISRITSPTAGAIGINGRVSSMLEVGTGFHGELTGRENIYLNGAILGMTKAEVNGKIDKIIEFSEIERFIDTPAKRYSSGMYVKLAFSVAAHLDSEIMIMDEVLAVGDSAFQKKCLGKMGDVSREEGRTILYVSHNMDTIRRLCDRCIVLDKGKITFDGEVEKAIELYSGV